VELTDEVLIDPSRIKEISGIVKNSVPIESHLIALAGWMRSNYGGTMNQALKTVIPVREKRKTPVLRTVSLAVDTMEAKNILGECIRKHHVAKARLLSALIEEGEIDYGVITSKLGVAGTVISGLNKQGVVKVTSVTEYRNPMAGREKKGYSITLNDEQQAAVDYIWGDYERGERATYLVKGVTGSGKTEVYMELISKVLDMGRQAIVLIPEIALTYQTVMRFYNRFGDRVSILNSRMSKGERYDQFVRAKNREIDIVIGPRSALFMPFPDLGLIIIDEEHETSYKSETIPRYHARETAIERAKMTGASVVLGSATPSLESAYRVKTGEYKLVELKCRVNEKPLPECEIIDLRDELKSGNRSILSRRLTELIEDRLAKKEQVMLFINRRGLAGFVSCRACGHVIKCRHCDVSLSQHTGGRMICHYCGYEEEQPTVCPSCGSRYISGFKAGTQKIEQVVKSQFPQARVLRMDMDTTRGKEGHEQILSAFANMEADILIGTQMIVKGHDFPNVTLVGVLAADMSLNVGDYHGAERTYQLLTQAAGRAGRGNRPGNVVIQTYQPDNYSIQAAKISDYDTFYDREIAYRGLMLYPPVWNMLMILCQSASEESVNTASDLISGEIGEPGDIYKIGPTDPSVSKINDIYRKVIYIKAEKYYELVAIKDRVEMFVRDNPAFKNVAVQFDFNPASGI
jgi:primosomal protein N' (replication factor Y)